jgi:hypothetical protein
MSSLKRILKGACAAWLLAGAAIVATAADTPPAGRVRGAITGPDHKALTGRLVTLRMIGGAGELRVTSTDERGGYQFRELPPGMYEVRVEADGYEPGVKGGIEVKPPFQNVVDIPMRALGTPAPAATGSIAALIAAAQALQKSGAPPPVESGPPASAAPVPLGGLLRDKDGAPILEATVLVLPAGGGALYQGRSDKEGRFRIDAVPPGLYRIVVRSPGHVPIDLARVEVPPATGLSLRLVLVDYPISFKAGPDTSLPPEQPHPWPLRPPAAVQPAPEPEEGPQTPPPAEPSRGWRGRAYGDRRIA